MLDWIFEGIITWVSSVVTDLMDAVSGLFLQALGTDTGRIRLYPMRMSLLNCFCLKVKKGTPGLSAQH